MEAIAYLFRYLARSLMHDVACKFACAVRMRRNNYREPPYRGFFVFNQLPQVNFH